MGSAGLTLRVVTIFFLNPDPGLRGLSEGSSGFGCPGARWRHASGGRDELQFRCT